MTDQTGADQFSNQRSKVGSNGIHSIAQILRELDAVCRDGNDLVTECVNMIYVGVGNFRAHGDFGGNFDRSFQIFR